MMNRNTRKGIIFFLSFILLFSLPVEVKGNTLTPHVPIRIESNADFTPANGVVAGNGTASNPYIIEGWDINASSAHGILIRDTDAYFIIRNCTIHDGGEYYNGIYLNNVTNGKIENVDSYRNYRGIHVYYSSNNSITNCDAYNNEYNGIELYFSPNNTITNCDIFENYNGICLLHSLNNVIANCDIYSNNETGIYAEHSSYNALLNCNIHNNDYCGLSTYNFSNNILSNCNFYNSVYGIDLFLSSNNNISNCQIYNNKDGIWFWQGSHNNIMTYSNIYNNTDNGIYVGGIEYGSSNTQIHYCNIYGNGDYGIYNDQSGEEYQTNATYCYWGHATGPYHPTSNPDGQGDKVSDNVVFNPWLETPFEMPNQPPVADFTYSPLNPKVNELIQFTDLSYDSDGTIISWQWNFGDGNFSNEQNPTHQYGEAGTYEVTLTVTDNDEANDSLTVPVTVYELNTAPVANDDSYSTDEDISLTVNAPGVLGNDYDADGDTLTAEIVSSPTHGSLTLNSDGSFAYTPDSNYHGTDSFTYQAYDGKDYSNEATVNITINSVNDAPVASDDYARVFAGSSNNKINVLENDTDVDGDTLTIISVTSPAHGIATHDGSYVYYTPDANYNGQDSFTYTISDGSLTDTATVYIEVYMPSISIVAPTSVEFGEEFTVDIVVDAENILAVQCYLRFDATLLEAINVTNGDMFDNLLSNGTIDNTGGRIDNILGGAFTPVGGGVFARVTFKAKNAVGNAFINFIPDACFVIDSENNQYPITFHNATVEVRNPPVYLLIEPSYEITKDRANLSIVLKPNGNEIWSVGFDLLFDPEYFNVTEVKDGGLFNTFNPMINNSGGYVRIIAFQIPPTGITEEGILATIEFEAKETGISELNMVNVDIRDPSNNPLFVITQNATLEADLTPPEVYITSLYPSVEVDGLTYVALPLTINATVIEDNLVEAMLIIIDNETGKFLYFVSCPAGDSYSLEWSGLYNLANGTLQEGITVFRSSMNGLPCFISFGYFNQTGGMPEIPAIAIFHENLTLMMIAEMDGNPINFTYGLSTYCPMNVFAQENAPPIFVNSSTIFVITQEFRLISVLPEERKYMVVFRAVDIVDNENATLKMVYVDNSPPASTLEIGEPKYDVYILPTTPIYINATDGGAGVNATYYKIDDGSWIEYTEPFTISEEGVHTIYYYSIDNLGNTEAEKSTVVYVDNTPPTTTLTFGTPYYHDGTDEWITNSTQITLTAIDEGSGVNKTYYKIDDGSWIEYTEPFTISSEGEHTVYYYSIDNLGNSEAEKSTVAYVDNTPPETTLTFDTPYYYDGTKEWITSSSLIILNAIDEGSGVNKTYYKIDDGSWIEYTEPFTISSEGEHTVYYYSIDNLGNSEAEKSTVAYVDNTPPETTHSLSGTQGEGGWYRSNVIVNLTRDDAGCGVNATYYKIGTGSWIEYTEPFTISSEGITTVYYYSRDNLENKEENKNFSVKIDKSAPTASHSLSGTLVEGKYTTDVTISFTSSDAVSGVKEIRYKVDGTSYVIYGSSGSYTVSSEGTHVVEYYAVDNAGNAGSTSSFSFTIQKNKPPTANFTYSPLQPYDTDTITFADNSIDPDGSIENYTWDFGDGNVSYSRNPTHKYADNGTYVVILTVKDDKGATNSTSQIIEVRNKPPVAVISYSPDKPKPKEDINFTSLSEDEDGLIVNYTWDFGDGNISYEQNPKHAYEKEGTYNVTLVVKDNDGATAQKTISLEIKAEKINIWLYLIIIIILIIIAIAVFAIWKRRSKGEEKPEEKKEEKKPKK